MSDVVFVYDENDPVREGCHRVIKTYDNLVPIVWADVPNGTDDPEPMYLCTDAVRLYYMSDSEFNRYSILTASDECIKSYAYNEAYFWGRVGIALGFVIIALMLTGIMIWGRQLYWNLVAISIVCVIIGIVCFPKQFRQFHTVLHKGDKQAFHKGERLCEELSEFIEEVYLSEPAKVFCRQISYANLLYDDIQQNILKMFTPSSLTAARFIDTSAVCVETIFENIRSAMVLMQQIVGIQDYRLMSNGSLLSGETEWRCVRDTRLTRVWSLVKSNEQLLDKMRDLSAAITDFSCDEISRKSEDALAEIAALIKDIPAYRDVTY